MRKVVHGSISGNALRLNSNGVETRKTILKTAAKLFGERGYSGTSFRDIADLSGIGLGSLVYHFGIKHNLYLETLKAFMVTEERLMEIYAPLIQCRKKTKSAVTNAIAETLATYLIEIHCNRKYPFLPQFFIRLLVDGDRDARKILDARLDLGRDIYCNFAMQMNPGFSMDQALAWRRFLFAQVQYTMISKKTVLKEFKVKSYTPALLTEIAREIAETSYLLLSRK